MSLKLRPFDAANYLTDEESVRFYLEEAIATGDVTFIAEALGTVARSKGMTEIARAAGVSRESLYRTLSVKGNPELATIIKVLDTLGLRLALAPKEASQAA
jgi:probable addiction module antidote protein